MTDDRLAFLDGAPLPVLRDLLSHEDPAQRADAACALGDRLRAREIDAFEPTIRDLLATLLDDGVAMVRFEAAIALAEAHDVRATDVLVTALEMRILRLDAIRALGTLADTRATPPLSKIMHRWLMPWADRLQAAAALCALGDIGGAAYLKERLNSRREAERAAAMHFIGESRHPEALVILRAAVENHLHPLRDVAVRALGLLGHPSGRNILEAARVGADDELKADIESAIVCLNRGSTARGC